MRQGQRDCFLQLTVPPLCSPQSPPSLLCPCPQHLCPHLVLQNKWHSSGETVPARSLAVRCRPLSLAFQAHHHSRLTSPASCCDTAPCAPVPLGWALHRKHASFSLTLTVISRCKCFWVPSTTWETALLLGGLNQGRPHWASSHIIPNSNLTAVRIRGPGPLYFPRPSLGLASLSYPPVSGR